MNAAHPHTPTRPLYERILKAVVIGGFSLLVLYLKAMAGILKLGIEAIRRAPTRKSHANA